jgi:hypothetical protein
MSIRPQYDINKIKFATDKSTFAKAVGLYEGGRVTNFKDRTDGFSATVIGTQPYYVFVPAHRYDKGSCDCYLGQRDIQCKHKVAVAICAVKEGAELSHDEKAGYGSPRCSGRTGEFSDEETAERKKEITEALKYITPYNGQSKIWFQYQRTLDEGRNRIAGIVSGLPVSPQTAGLLVDLLLRMERKLMNGVDDSNGTVSGCMSDIVDVLLEFAKLNPECVHKFKKLQNLRTSFEWEEPLVHAYRASLRRHRRR